MICKSPQKVVRVIYLYSFSKSLPFLIFLIELDVTLTADRDVISTKFWIIIAQNFEKFMNLEMDQGIQEWTK